MEDISGIGKLAETELAKRVYEETVSPPATEAGGLLTDVIKTLRLFTAPFQLAAVAQDRLATWLNQIRERVPLEKQKDAPAHIAGPAIRSLIMLEDDNPLLDLYLELLTRAIDKDRDSEAHPAFIRIIDQLSPDEALIMYYLRNPGSRLLLEIAEHTDLVTTGIPANELVAPEHIEVYCFHLESLNLLTQARDAVAQTWSAAVSLSDKTPRSFKSTSFGRLFVRACIPEDFRLPSSPIE